MFSMTAQVHESLKLRWMVGGREGTPVVVRVPKSDSFCLLLLKVQHYDPGKLSNF